MRLRSRITELVNCHIMRAVSVFDTGVRTGVSMEDKEVLEQE